MGLKRYTDDIFIFDIATGCNFIASAGSGKINVGSSIYDIMTPSDAEEMLAYLMSYSDAVMFVQTSRGVAAVFPSLVPSCSLGILVFASVGTDCVRRIAKRYGLHAVFSDSLTVGKRCRLTKEALQKQAACIEFIDKYDCIFSGTAANQLLQGDITRELGEKISLLSDFFGVPVTVSLSEPIIALGDFDLSLFVGFLLVSLITARALSICGKLHIGFDIDGRGIYINIGMTFDGDEAPSECAINHLYLLASRKGLFFDKQKAEGVYRIKFSPMPIDWSRFGFKSPGAPQKEE